MNLKTIKNNLGSSLTLEVTKKVENFWKLISNYEFGEKSFGNANAKNS